MNIVEILAKVGFDWRLALLNLINFLIIFYLLKKFLFGPVVKKLDERRELIREGVENAKKAETELKMSHQKAQEVIDEAKGEANTLIGKAHTEAEELAEQMKGKARKEIEALIVQAKKNIAIEKEEMHESLRKETVELVVLALEKLIGEKLDVKKDEKYIQEILKNA